MLLAKQGDLPALRDLWSWRKPQERAAVWPWRSYVRCLYQRE